MAGSAAPPARILVAGAGAFGREHLDRLTARGDARVVGVADPNPAALAHVRERYGIAQCFESARQLFDQVAADALIVATPSATHADIALQAIARKLAVLIEKPVAPDAGLAARLADAAEQASVLALPGHVLRFSRDHQRLAEAAHSGRIGRVLYVNSRRYRDDGHAVRYRDVDPVLMTMIHDIDLALWIAQSPFRSTRAWRSGEDAFRSLTAAAAVTESGVICDLRTAWTFAAGELPPDRVEVVGEQGSIELEVGQPLRLFTEGRRTEIPPVASDDALTNEHDHFLACLRDRRLRPALTLRDATAGLRLADAVLDSLRRQRDVSLGA